MSDNLNLEMRLTANGSQLSTALNNAGTNVRAFTNNVNNASRSIVQGFQKVYQQLNGFSTISKLAVAAGGYSILSEALHRNLEFEKTLLDMKQTAQMTVQEAAEMRRLAIDAASANLATPSDIAAGMKAFSAAGMKFDSIKPSIEEAARAAVAFRSTVEQIALLDFDLQDKMKLDPSQIKAAHNMLLYHAKSGRFEAGPMAAEAPKYLNSAASVGITGLKGLNLIGAMTQILMKLAPATQPSEVSTFMEHGFGHLASDRYVKGLAKSGIDIKKYMPDGKFYGQDGVQGFLDLLAAMESKGLENPFKLDKSGFREMYSKKFWKQLMADQKAALNGLNAGEAAASDDMVGRDKAEIMNSNFGQMKQAQITKEKGQLSDSATSIVSAWAKLNGWAAENPVTAGAAGVATVAGLRLLKNKMAGGNVLEKALGGVGGAGMPVVVTNWPAGLGDSLKPSERLRRLPGAAGAEAASGAVAGSAALAAAVPVTIGLGGAAMSVAALQATQANQQKLNDMSKTAMGGALAGDNGIAAAILTESQKTSEAVMKSHSGFEAWLDNFSAKMASLLGGVAERPVEVHIDGHVVAESVNKSNSRAAGRQ